jgi:hypothetical protein
LARRRRGCERHLRCPESSQPPPLDIEELRGLRGRTDLWQALCRRARGRCSNAAARLGAAAGERLVPTMRSGGGGGRQREREWAGQGLVPWHAGAARPAELAGLPRRQRHGGRCCCHRSPRPALRHHRRRRLVTRPSYTQARSPLLMQLVVAAFQAGAEHAGAGFSNCKNYPPCVKQACS